MKKQLVKVISCALALCLLGSLTIYPSAAPSASELQNSINQLEKQSKSLENEIKALQGQINQQEKLKNAIQQKISVTQQQISLCNNEIAKINSKIAANKAEIDKNRQEMESDQLSFKKRLRAIYMSNTGSNVQILLGADDFSEFLQLSQLTASVSARDKLLMEKITAAIEALEEKQKENDKLLQDQVAIKETIRQKQQQLEQENAQINAVINSIEGDKSKAEKDNAQIEKQIKDYKSTLASMMTANNTNVVYDGGVFLWPVPGFYGISAGFQSNDSVHKGKHDGVDIYGSGIQGKPVVAIADGVVEKSNNSCTHNYKKNGSCGCGGGFGNYVKINHGAKDGRSYVAIYGHMSSIAVGTGSSVKKGQVVGYVGTTGWSTGYHLHLGIAVNGTWKDPMSFYRKVN